MNDDKLLQDDQQAVIVNLLYGYGADRKAHLIAALLNLPEKYSATADGALVFGAATGQELESKARAELTRRAKTGEFKFDGRGKNKTVRLQSPRPRLPGRFQDRRKAEKEMRAAVVAVLEKGGHRLVTELHNAALSVPLGIEGVPPAMLFGIICRLIDDLVDEKFCERGLTPHEGGQVETLKGKEGAAEPETIVAAAGDDEKSPLHVNRNATEPTPAIDLALTEKDKDEYGAALGVPTSAQKDRPAATPSRPLDESLADIAWANASEADRRRFLTEQLGNPDVVARVRETLAPTPKADEQLVAQ